MPAPSLAAPAAPRTFWSDAALAAAVDAVFAEALAEEMAAAFRESTPAEHTAGVGTPAQYPEDDDVRPGIVIVLPDTDILIREAGIVTGPCPPDPRVPSRSGQAARAAGRHALRAAWVLLKYTTLFTAGTLAVTVRVLWDILIPSKSSAPQIETPPPGVVRALRAADFLEATSETIKTRGWIQGDYSSSDGVCLLGAENALVWSDPGSRKTASDANAYLRSVIGRRSIPRWNDNLHRTEEQVHRALLAAAARARAAAAQ
ncbi:DUF6197 family protein [Streptomyces sasae]|uniref:DUF6197 family protein n=1 Tax=Streptomyces sasae TaxID=1266772 RepID=UPI00292D283D|nr:hypothetical protein [Streptomyces sasae]